MVTALHYAQEGAKLANAKPLQGFSGASVLEIVESDPSGTYPLHVYSPIPNRDLRLACISEEVSQGDSHTKRTYRYGQASAEAAAEIDAEITDRKRRGKDDHNE